MSCNTNETEKSESTVESNSEAGEESKGDLLVQSKTVEDIQGYLGEEVDRSMKATAVFYNRPYTLFAEDNPDYGKKSRLEDDRICNFKQPVKARYVRLSFETVPSNSISAFVYLGEFEIMGMKNPENAVPAVYDESIPYGNYPNPEKYGMSDILFTCIGDTRRVYCIP